LDLNKLYRFVEIIKISTSEEWSSLGGEANGDSCSGAGAPDSQNEGTNNLHLLASAGLTAAAAAAAEDQPLTGAGLEADPDGTHGSNGVVLPDNSVLDSSETPKKRRRRSSDSPGGTGPIKMQTEQVVRVPGLPGDLQQQITKFDSSEFDDDKEVPACDAEGVWAPDIEQSFQEALAIYPPCGRRKIILSDEGKMYGRNELIARYIKLRTGKTRTRKQVSSHIQVLARRKLREIQAKLKVNMVPNNGSPASYLDHAQREKALQSMQQMSSAQIVSASAMHNKTGPLGMAHTPVSYGGGFWQPGIQAGAPQDVKPFGQSPFGLGDGKPPMGLQTSAVAPVTPAWQGRAIATQRLRLLEFSAYVEQRHDETAYPRHIFVNIGSPVSYSDPPLEPIDVRQIQDKFPEKKGGLKELFERGPQDAFFLVKFWADLNTNIADEPGASYMVNTTYESNESITIQCSTKVCSFGKQVVEKLETEFAKPDANGRFVYKIQRSPMCEYMINFIHKLKHLPEKYMMNSVLENFTILQVISNRDTQETLLCIAFVFEVSTSEHGAQHHIYRLVKD